MPLKLDKRDGSPYWYIRGTVRGKSVRESTGTADREAAEAVRIQREAQLLERSVYGARAVATFAEVMTDYLNHGGEARYLVRLLDHFGTTPIAKIDQSAIDLAARKLYPGRAPATLNRQVYTPMSAVLTHAAKRGLADPPRLDRPRQPKGRVRWLTTEEAERLIDAAAPHLRPLLIFLIGTGARLSEALYLDWRNVNLERAHVMFLDTKNGEDRGVPLNSRVVETLAALPHRDGAVFRTQKGLPYAIREGGGGQIKNAFRGACRRAGIENFSPHDCRHTWATWHYTTHRDLKALKELGGWKSLAMVDRYTHLNTDHLRDQIDRFPWAVRPKSAQSMDGT